MGSRCRAQAMIEFGLPLNWIALVIERLTRDGAHSLTSNELYMIFKRVGNLLRTESSVLHVQAECRVVGNLCGSVDSLRAIFCTYGWPSDVCYVFLGDYICADRGELQMDVFLLLLIFKMVYPKHILLLRGSAECEHCAAELGLIDLLASSFTVSLYQVIKDVFKYLPLAAQVNSVYLLSNTSLSLDRGTLVDLELVVRPCTICLRGKNILTLAMQAEGQSEYYVEDEETVGSPVLSFLKKSSLRVSVRDGAQAIESGDGCRIEGKRSNLISLVSATAVNGNSFNGAVLAIHRNNVCTFHSVDPKEAKPKIRLIMPLTKNE